MRSGFGSLRAAVLAGALLASACSPAAPDAGAMATTPTAATNPTSTANATPTPTPSPTGSALGPVGTIAFQDDKVWLVTPEGDYTMNIPAGMQGVTPSVNGTEPPYIATPGSEDLLVSYKYWPGLTSLPSEAEVMRSIGFAMVNEPLVRNDIKQFGGMSAVAGQARTINDSYFIISVAVNIGGSFWTLNFSGVGLEETEQLLRQASDSLTKQP